MSADDGAPDLMAALEESLRPVRHRLSTTHGYYKAQGFESCPDCGYWLGSHSESDEG